MSERTNYRNRSSSNLARSLSDHQGIFLAEFSSILEPTSSLSFDDALIQGNGMVSGVFAGIH
jgi:hypothetical protein